MLVGENGIITQAQRADELTTQAQQKEAIELAVASVQAQGTLALDKTKLETALQSQLGDTAYTLTENGDGSFLLQIAERSYYIDSTGEVITQENMIAIGSAEELKAFRDDVNSGNTYEGKYVYLTGDITLDNSEQWEPIGLYPNNTTGPDDEINNRYFKGIFDGKNYEINGIYINNSNKGQAFIGLTKNAIIKNIVLGSNNSINGGADTAGIVAYCYSSKIENCTNKSNITANENYAGGIVGYTYQNSVIENCENKGNITINDGSYSVGGIAGYQQSDSQIIKCINSGIITGDNHAGGITGSSGNSRISNCANTGTVITTTKISGGIVGIASGRVNIDSCYNTGNIKSVSGASGIVAYLQSSPNVIINNCYTTGSIEADYNAVAICIVQQDISLKINNCYYLQNTINGVNEINEIEGVTSKNNDELKNLSTILGEAFKQDINNINQGYPILAWQRNSTIGV